MDTGLSPQAVATALGVLHISQFVHSPTPSSSYTPECVAAHLTALPSGSGFCSPQPWARQDAAQTTTQASCQGCSSQLLTGRHPTHCDVKATTILKSFPGAFCIKMQVEMEVSGTTYSQLSHLGPLLSLHYLRPCWRFIPAVCESPTEVSQVGLCSGDAIWA